MLIQFILCLILTFAFVVTWRRVRAKALRLLEGIGWSILWMGACIAVLRPETTTVLAHFVGVGRGVDLVLYAAIIMLLFLCFHLSIAHERLERSLTKLVRAEAIKEAMKDADASKNDKAPL